MKNFILFIILSCFFLIANANNIVQKDSSQAQNNSSIEIFDRAEVMPQYPDGIPALMSFLSRNIRYPSLARENGLEGKVIVKFFVDIDGTVKEPIVIKDGVGGGAAEESVRVISAMPKWLPGSQKGKPVKVYYVLPITFKLTENENANSIKPMEAIFKGGDVGLEFFKQDVISKIKKSKQEKNKQIIVKVSFVIDELGKVSSATIFEKNTNNKIALDKILSEVNNMPLWFPKMINGKTIGCSKILTFEY